MAAAMRKQEAVLAAVVLALVVLWAAPGGARAGGCEASQLAVCLVSITTGLPPSKGCCDTLKAQEPCLCQYAKDPEYGRYIKNPNARKTLQSCGISLPAC